MAIAISETVSGGSANVSSYSLTSWSPSANDVILLAVETRNTTVTHDSVSGNGATWTKIADVNGSSSLKLTLWKGVCGGSPSSGQVTVTLSASALAIAAQATRFSGVDTTTPTGTAVTAQSTSTAVTVNLTTTGTNSKAWAAIGTRDTGDVSAVGTGETANLLNVASVGHASGDRMSLSTEYQDVASASTVTLDATLSASKAWAIAAVELYAATGGGSVSLSASGTIAITGSATLSSSGGTTALSASGTIAITGSATLSTTGGSAALSASGTMAITGSASLTVTGGSATFAASGTIRITGSATLSIAGSGVWHSTRFKRPLIDRYLNITIAASAGTGYLGVSKDGSSYTWYSGPLGADGRTLTAVADEAAAKLAAIALPAAGVWSLPTTTEARYFVLGHKGPGTAYVLREFYPRRLVEADDIRAETIKAIHIAAGTITGDRLFATAIDGMTITGATIRTAASGFRVVMSGNNISTYDASNVLQAQLDGAGLFLSSALTSQKPIRFGSTADPAIQGSIQANAISSSTGYSVALNAQNNQASASTSKRTATLGVKADTQADTSQFPLTLIYGSDLSATTLMSVRGDGYLTMTGTSPYLRLNNIAGGASLRTGIQFQNGSTAQWDIGVDVLVGGTRDFYFFDAVAGVTRMIIGPNGRVGMGIGNAEPSAARLAVRGENTSTANYALQLQNSTPSNLILVRNDGAAGSCASIVAWTLISDRKVKNNIKDMSRGLADLRRLKPRTYDRTDVAKFEEHGFVAQELAEVFPEIVHEVEPGKLGITYGELIPVLVKAVQELSAQVERLSRGPKGA